MPETEIESAYMRRDNTIDWFTDLQNRLDEHMRNDMPIINEYKFRRAEIMRKYPHISDPEYMQRIQDRIKNHTDIGQLYPQEWTDRDIKIWLDEYNEALPEIEALEQEMVNDPIFRKMEDRAEFRGTGDNILADIPAHADREFNNSLKYYKKKVTLTANYLNSLERIQRNEMLKRMSIRIAIATGTVIGGIGIALIIGVPPALAIRDKITTKKKKDLYGQTL